MFIDLILAVETFRPGGAEFAEGGAVFLYHRRRQVKEVGDLHQLGVGIFRGDHLDKNAIHASLPYLILDICMLQPA